MELWVLFTVLLDIRAENITKTAINNITRKIILSNSARLDTNEYLVPIYQSESN